MEPKQKQHTVVDVTGDGSKVQSFKEQYCIGTWNVRSMNQGKLEVVKQEMARVMSTFWEKALESPLHCKEIQPVHSCGELPVRTGSFVRRTQLWELPQSLRVCLQT